MKKYGFGNKSIALASPSKNLPIPDPFLLFEISGNNIKSFML